MRVLRGVLDLVELHPLNYLFYSFVLLAVEVGLVRTDSLLAMVPEVLVVTALVWSPLFQISF